MVSRDGCQEFYQQQVNRRQALTVGSLAGMGLTLPDWFRLRRTADADEGERGTFGCAKSVIILFLHGGHPQHETWDPKPEAPAEIRGEFGDIATKVPGMRFSELFPRMARIADKLALVRSMSHSNPNHVQACLPAWTGHRHPQALRSRGDFPPSTDDFPPFGAVLDHLRPAQRLPSWVRIGPLMTRNNGTVLHGQLPGFLGRRHGPFIVDQDLTAPQVRIEAVRSRAGVPAQRLEGRRDLLAEVDGQRRLLDRCAEARDLDSHYQRAFHLLTSGAVHKAFDLSSEPQSTREKYSYSQFGQSCLLARRLAEAGAPMITVHFCKTPKGSWDTHSKNFEKMKSQLAPTLDQAFSALVSDLDQRGMLDETLVVALAEFGRTPKINRNAGRDHWPWAYTLALAGAGIRRGLAYGASDRMGAYPDSAPHAPRDFAATLYHLLGISSNVVLYDGLGRPRQLVVGKPIEGILA